MTDARPAAPSRRSVLAAGAALVLAGCTNASSPPAPGPTRDQRLAARVADEIRALSARYAATITQHSALRDELSPLAAEHDSHIKALTDLLPEPTASPSTSATPQSPAASTPAPTVPTTPTAARSALKAAERAAARRRRSQAGSASPELARLLASVAACEAVHAALLRGAS